METVKAVNAFVKQELLQHYGWEHEDKLTLICKLIDLDEDKGLYLFQAYNHDKDSWNGVTNNQVVMFDKSILDTEPLLNGYKAIIMNGQDVYGIGRKRENKQ